MRGKWARLVVGALACSSTLVVGSQTPVRAVDPLAVPAFSVSRGSNPVLAKLTFTADGRARYEVRAYFSVDNFTTPYIVNSDYTPGQDLSNVANPSPTGACSTVISRVVTAAGDTSLDYCREMVTSAATVRFSLLVTQRSDSTQLPESPKSDPVGFLHNRGGLVGWTSAQGTEGIKFSTGTVTGATGVEVRIHRSDDYSQVFSTTSLLPLSTNSSLTTVEVPGGYSYKFTYRFIGGKVGNVQWFDGGFPTTLTTPVAVAVKPGRVSNVVATTTSDAQLRVTWTPPSGGTTPTSYAVFVRPWDEVGYFYYTIENPVSAPATSAVISGYKSVQSNSIPFEMGVKYQVAVQSRFTSGGTTGSSDFVLALLPGIPAVPPSQVSVSATAGDRRIDVSWSPPSSTGGVALTSYDIAYSADGTNWTTQTSGGDASSVSIGSLTQGVTYAVKVRAVNPAGEGYWSEVVSATPFGAPTPVTADVLNITSTSARIGMTMNATAESHAVKLEYELDNANTTFIALGNTLSNSFSASRDIYGLVAGRRYRVRAVATAGSDTYRGLWKYFTTTPAKVTNVAVVPSLRSAVVTWDNPSVGTAQRTYRAWATRSGSTTTRECTVDATSSARDTCSITELDPSTLYTIRVTSTVSGGDFGNGTSPAAESTTTTKQEQRIVDKSNLIPQQYWTSSSTSPPLLLEKYFSSSSGLKVSVASTTSSTCTVTSGYLNAAGAGTCTLNLTQAGNTLYGSADSVSVSIPIAGAQTITFSFDGFTGPRVGEAAVDIANRASASSGLTPDFISKSPEVCTVTDAKVAPVTSGTCWITALQTGNSDFLPAEQVTKSFSVGKGDQQALTITSTGGAFTTPVDLSTSGGSGTGNVRYAVSPTGNTSACVKTANGVKAAQPGNCPVTATKLEDANYLEVSSSLKTLVFSKGEQTISFREIPNTLEGSTVPISASSTSELTVTVVSTTPSVCSVSGSNVVLDAAGTCTLTASQGGTALYLAASDVTMTFQSNQKPAARIGTVGYDRSLTYYIGSTVDFYVLDDLTVDSRQNLRSEVDGTFSWWPAVAGSLEFDPQDASLATIKTRPTGESMVVYYKFTPDAQGATQVNPTVGAFALNVALAPQSVSLVPRTVEYNRPAQMSLTGVLGTGAITYDFSSVDTQGNSTSARNADCVVVNSVVTRSRPGTCVVRARIAADAQFAQATAISEFVFTKKSQSLAIGNSWILDNLTYADRESTIDVGAMAFSTLDSESAAGQPKTVSTSSSACSITAGVLSIVSAGQCEIDVSTTETETIAAAPPFRYSFTIGKAPQSRLELTSLSGIHLQPLVLTTSGGTGAGEVSFTAADGTAAGCRIEFGQLLADSAGSCLVTTLKLGTSNHLPQSEEGAQVVLAKNPHTLTFSVSSLGSPRKEDGAFSLAVAAYLSSGRPVQFRSLSESVCTLAGSLVTPVSAGDCVVEAWYDEDESFTTVEPVTRTITILGAQSPPSTVASTLPPSPNVGSTVPSPNVGSTVPSPSPLAEAPKQVSAGLFVASARLVAGMSKTLVASWSAASGSGVRYTATLSPGGKGCTVTATTCVFRGLDASVRYSVSVVASDGSETSREAVSAAVAPTVSLKVKGRLTLASVMTPASRGSLTWRTSGGCRVAGRMFLARTTPGRCTLTLVTGKTAGTPATTRRATVVITSK